MYFLTPYTLLLRYVQPKPARVCVGCQKVVCVLLHDIMGTFSHPTYPRRAADPSIYVAKELYIPGVCVCVCVCVCVPVYTHEPSISFIKEPYILRKRALHIPQKSVPYHHARKSPTYSTKEPYIFRTRTLRIFHKRALHFSQKSPPYSAKEPSTSCNKEPCTFCKRALHIFHTRTLHIYNKRALYIPQKSPIYSAKEPYTFRKRALHIPQQSPPYLPQKSPTYFATMHSRKSTSRTSGKSLYYTTWCFVYFLTPHIPIVFSYTLSTSAGWLIVTYIKAKFLKRHFHTGWRRP